MDRADLMKIRDAAAASLHTDGDYAALMREAADAKRLDRGDFEEGCSP